MKDAPIKVRVKPDMPESFRGGFYGDQRRLPGDEFELIERTSTDKKTVLTPEEQFSDRWMERMEEPRKGPGRPKTLDVDTA